jgi:hypothetical protein
MPLIVQNTTGDDIEIVQLGLTVPASDIYDLSLRQQTIIAASDELAGHIASGNLTVTADTLNTLANATGYFQIVSGEPEDRPASPPTGTMRHNANTNVVEIYQSGAWQSMPNMQSTIFAIDSVTGVLCSFNEARAKYLSVAIIPVTYTNANAADQSWLYIDSNINHSQSGYVSPVYGVITNISVYTDMMIDKDVSVYVNDTLYANVVTFAGEQKANSVTTYINFDPGDTVRIRVNSTNSGVLGAMYATVFVSLRGTV